MTDGRKKNEIDFAAKRRSLLHTYDVFISAQTRIFTLANYKYSHVSGDVESQQEQLFFDDFLNFGISARRLIELAGVKSFANHVFVPEQFFDSNVSLIKLSPVGTKIGFLALINCVVHAKYVRLLRSRFDLWPYGQQVGDEKDVWAQYKLFEKITREDRWQDYAIDVSVIVASDTDRLTMVKLSDVIKASVEVIERVVQKCDGVGIYLEMDMRKLD